MSEYIERKVLLEAVRKMDRLDKETKTPYEYDKQGYLLLINNAPGIEIVRCKECKYWTSYIEPSSGSRFDGYCVKRGFSFTKRADFCSEGEGKEK